MKLIYKNLPFNKIDGCVVTVGVFDGVHLGHQYILNKIKRQAEKKNKPSLAISFDIPPEKVLNSKKKFKGYLTDYKQKISLIESLGIDYLWLLKTELNLLQFSADKFLSYINKYFVIDEMIVGDDFRFGIKAETGSSQLSQLAERYGFGLKIIDKKSFSGVRVSSSLIRKLIKSSKIKQVKKLLGKNYTLKGKVIKGKGVGKQLGFSTANLNTFDYVLPKQGVYAAYSRIGDTDFLAAVNIGKKDFEVHLLNFSKDILNDTIEVTLLEKIRDESNFQSKNNLVKQIQKDIQAITSKYSIPPD
ncbi:MAG: riboflavin biosynthesis protein RibF [Candidatus Omnitrophica bacterium]|nr:riboflavin biosynthesis protein RibF [Candidatus Omnitrophota bacterium]MCF7894535.1 riboflavin biosynthesis protein RibF [Candidatus Omnitrophota bacterium]